MKIKKTVFFFLTIVFLFSLTSCQVNMFDKSYDVDWWIIAIPVILLTVTALMLAGKHIAKKKYVCVHCDGVFHPKWWKAAVSLHVNDDRFFQCPICKKRGFCHPSYQQEDK